MIYAIKAGGYTKIGTTKDFDKRLRSIQNGCPFKIEVLFLMEGSFEQESKVHRQLKLYNTYGEWYQLPIDVDVELLEFLIEEYDRQEELSKMEVSTSSSDRIKLINKERTESNGIKVKGAIEKLNEMREFITSANIAEVSELSVRTVERYVPMYKEEIDSYNMSNFDTTNFHSYTKDQNVYRIIDAIREATALEKKLSKTDLAEATELTRMTIHRLWNDKRIQEVMTKYNKELV